MAWACRRLREGQLRIGRGCVQPLAAVLVGHKRPRGQLRPCECRRRFPATMDVMRGHLVGAHNENVAVSTDVRPLRAARAAGYVGAFFAGGLALSALYATTGLGLPCPFRLLTGW